MFSISRTFLSTLNIQRACGILNSIHFKENKKTKMQEHFSRSENVMDHQIRLLQKNHNVLNTT